MGCKYSVHAESPIDHCLIYPNICHGHNQCVWGPQRFSSYKLKCEHRLCIFYIHVCTQSHLPAVHTYLGVLKNILVFDMLITFNPANVFTSAVAPLLEALRVVPIWGNNPLISFD